MASIIQRGRLWGALIVRRGQRVSASFDTRAQAEEWAIEAEAAILAGARAQKTRPLPASATVADFFSRYSAQVSPEKKGVRWEQIRLAALPRKHAAFRRPVADFDAAAVAEWRDERLKEVSPHTVNRELNLVSAVMNTALKEWRVPHLKTNPVHAVLRPKVPRARKRRVSPAERAAICSHLGWDEKSTPIDISGWTAFAFCLALETAMRKGELLSLRWGNVWLDECYVHLGDTKNGDERDVPLSSKALALIRLLPAGESGEALIPVASGTLDMTFRRAKIDAGLIDLRFHDSRREATTVMSKKLGNVLELAAVTGHRSLRVLQEYYRPKPGDLAAKLG